MKDLTNLIIRDKYDSGGRCSNLKGDLIRKLIIENNLQICVEIGIFKGSSLMYFADALQTTKGKVIGIDPYYMDNFKNEIPNIDVKSKNYIYDVLFNKQIILDNIYDVLKDTIIKNDLEHIITLVRDKSENYISQLQKESIDMLHIDGNHDEEYVTKDILLYLPLIKVGGYIIMDDITWPGVINSINNHLNEHVVLVGLFEDFSIYQKK